MFFNIDIKYISNREICSNDNVRFIPWNADAIMNELLSSDVAIVCQGDSKNDSLRSNNRLLVCLAAGIPTIAINSKSYKETMIAADLENQIFNDYEDVTSKFRMILHAPVRNRISLIGKEYAWKNFSPAIVATKLRKVFEEAIYA
jgi:glycosyltransferase involved in cell wall biosynthesis